MRVLLDTHIFLWYITNDRRLPPSVADAVSGSQNEAYLSVVSVWEALVKYQLGRLSLPSPADQYLQAKQTQHRIAALPLEGAAVSHLLDLPPLHRDPFDRILVCQAIHHDLVLITTDEQLVKYPVRLLPAR
jgi:PIN domain nuclease of toxin-antitoxin system